jgi:hypothetical protein
MKEYTMRNTLAVPVAVFITIALVGCGSAPTKPTSTNLSTVPGKTDIAALDVYIPGTYTWDYDTGLMPTKIGTVKTAVKYTPKYNTGGNLLTATFSPVGSTSVALDGVTYETGSIIIEPKIDFMFSTNGQSYALAGNP